MRIDTNAHLRVHFTNVMHRTCKYHMAVSGTAPFYLIPKGGRAIKATALESLFKCVYVRTLCSGVRFASIRLTK
jgi:hypothetical protein